MNEITKPLVLAYGSHKAGSGYGCAMNVLSWESGDATITDYPACTYGPLAELVQELNDELATIKTDVPMDEGLPGHVHVIPAHHAVEVLAIAHRTVGSGQLPPEALAAGTAAFMTAIRGFRDEEFIRHVEDHHPATWSGMFLYGEWATREKNGREERYVSVAQRHIQPLAVFERFNVALDAFWAAAHAEPTPVPETVTAEAVTKMQEVFA